MKLQEFLSDLTTKDIKLWLDSGRLLCDAPEGVLTSTLRAQLAEFKQDIINFLQKPNSDCDFYLQPIVPVPRDDQPLPSSFAQERLWFFDQLEEKSATYNVPQAVRMTGDLNVSALKQAIAKIIDRHEVLRTHFPSVDGKPIQVIDPEATLQIVEMNWQHLPQIDQELQVQNYIQQEVHTPFDLSQGPLVRVTLLQLAPQESILLITMHHIISDGWSIAVFVQELFALYQAYSQGKPNPLPELSIQYADYALWQRQWLTGKRQDKQLQYWQQQLAGAPCLLTLPNDHPRPPVQTHRGHTQTFALDKQLTQQLEKLSDDHGSTLFMTLLAAFAVLLFRYSGQDDILIGSPIANRNRPEIESLIGFFVNTLVLRTRLQGNPSFAQLLRQVREVTLEAYQHQDVPFEQVVEALQPERTLSYSPLFQVMFVLQNIPMCPLELPGVSLTPLRLQTQTAKFDLLLSMEQTETGLVGLWEYSTDLFEAETIAQMAGHFQTLLVAIASNPQQTIGQLPLLKDKELHQILWEWNNTTTEYPQHKCIHQLFEEQVEKNPEAIAIVFKQQQLTYQELNQKANQLARYLQALGIKPEVLVGICVERSLEMMVGLLGILKAGGAYLPLDPTYPKDRLAYILSDSQVPVLLTQQHLVGSLPEHQASIIYLDSDWTSIAQESENNLACEVTAENLAYIIYTSGSTGQPKGVSVAHKNLLNLVFWHQRVFEVNPSDRATQLAKIAFDASVWEIWPYLAAGASLFLVETELLSSPMQLQEWFVSKEVTITFLPTPLANELFALEWPKNLALRIVLVGGDRLHQLPTASLPFKVINNYGPTENTVVTSSGLIIGFGQDKTSPHIGRPIDNTHVYILDRYLQPLPIGVSGELHIGGAGLARGYLNRAELTKEKFIPNPFSNEAGTRLYKTGDLARYLPDGNIEFMGRLDHQVKIRGFRIELGEIEAVLNTYPSIQQAVVIATEEINSQKCLVAYLISTDESLTTNKLREFLRQKLPEYMIPSTFVVLEKLPLTPNGKIDRRALPLVEYQLTLRAQKEYIRPRTGMEQTIADIFAAVLKVPAVGIHDNFFELGGHSLIATQVIDQLKQVFEVQLPLKTLFEYPTVAQLHQVLAQLTPVESLQQTSDLTLPTLTPAPEERYQPFPLTEIQQAYWLGRNRAFELGNIASHIYIELDCQDLNLERLNQAWQTIIDHHEMMRMVVRPDGQQQILQQVPAYQIEIFELCGHSQNSINSHLERMRQQMSHQVFDSEQWPLFKLCATQLDPHRTRLHLSFDALIADAMSLMNFGQQWWQLYQNPQAALPKVEASFRDYVLAELFLKDTPQYQRSQEYWGQRLSTLPPAPALPFAQQPSTIKQPQFKRFSGKLSPQQWQKLQNKANKANLTASGVLLAAFSDILTCWSKTPHFTINLTLFNRLPLHPQVNEIVGDFTSLTLLEVDNSTVATFVERAQRLQAQLWQDLDHRYVSGVAVQRQLRRERGTYQAMGVVFTSTLGVTDLAQQDWWVNKFGEMVYSITQTPQVWLDHQVIEEQGALLFNWDVVEELFPPGMVDEMFSSYCNYLQQLASDEQSWQENYPQLLSVKQLENRQQLNQTTSSIEAQTLDGLFVQQANKQGTSPAVITTELTLTYEQLYQRALKLGHQLRQRGATTNHPIAVVMEKGWQQVVAVLGILMSGAPYVPIDPKLPQQRQWSLLAQAHVDLVVTQESLSRNLSWPEGIECLYVEYHPEIPDQKPLEPLHQPSDLAYVIYTSGSTGVPKGVMIDHLGAVNTIIDINQRFGVTARDRVLAVSALNFDLSVYDIFGILAAGGTIVMPTYAGAKDPTHWLSLIFAHHVTVWNSVPALMQMLVEYTSVQPTLLNPTLRLVLLSGDWLPLNLPQQIKALWPDVEVISLGGATEASIWSIYYPIEEVLPNWRSIPYGKPLGNQTFHVLNQWMTPSPVWVPGQLYIGGMGLAKGYWQDEHKTLNSFITHPLTQERLYKTGDLGRYLPDGNIEFLGREDFQVKINGYRIELGEIEAALMQNSLVNKAVVKAVGDSTDKKQLVAYIVSSATLPKLPEAYQPSEKEGMIVDPIERIEFKLKQPGLRKLASTDASVELPLPIDDQALTTAYLKRQSYRQFDQQPLDLQEFSQFLSCLRQLSLPDLPLPKYRYPSAGNLYPVQTYLLIKPQRLTGVEGGIYYYCPRQHRLVLLSPMRDIEGDIYGGNQPIFEQGAFSLFLIGKLDAITPMYGEMAEKFCLLEAGHIGQLLMSNAPDFGLGLCPIGNLDFSQLRDLFNLESNQLLLYSFVGGKIDPNQTQQWLRSVSSSQTSVVSQLRQYLQQCLPEYMLPAEYVLLDSLPLSANGKIDRQNLPIPDTLNSSDQKNFVPPRDLVELKLTKIWSNTLNVGSVGVQDNFFDLGGNSLFAIRLMTQIEQQFQRNLPLATLLQGQTIEKLATIWRDQPDAISWSSLVPIQTSGSKLPFFCIAGGGGNVLYFYHLARHLGSDQPFYALQAVGLDGESEPLTRVEDMAAHYIEGIKSVQPKGPYLLGGHSFGGIVAFETAQQLQKQGHEVALLAILDMGAPDVNTSNMVDVNWDGAKMLTRTASIFERMFGKDIGVSYHVLKRLAPEEQLEYVSERFQIANIFPPGVGTKQLRGLLRVGKVNQETHYVPQEVHPTDRKSVV